MASGFPGSIDNFTDPTSTSALNSPSHSGQHADLNDAVEKIETYMGLVKVIPTSVSSAGGTAATLAANGTITIGTSNTSVTVSGAFSSLYDNYRIVLNGGTTSASGYWQMRLGASNASYYGGVIYVVYSSGAVAGLSLNNAQQFSYIGGMNQNQTSINVDVMSPYLTKFTYVYSSPIINGSNYGQFIGDHEINASYSDFTLYTSTGTATGGTIRIYGYRN